MRRTAILGLLVIPLAAQAAELESRALTHYIPQDLLETVVRKEGWTEIVLKPYNGVRKGDIARIWSGGVIDHGGGNQPGVNVAGPQGMGDKVQADASRLSLSQDVKHGFALLFKTDDGKIHRCAPPGKPLQVPLTTDGARLWIGFNDQKGRYSDNHLGRGRRYELDPLWVRIEVVRIVVD
ncbi:MAG: hypothetical protein FJ271_21560 [Planctomycetes bacterium]|nr:hypothetical protein [Planctomycetota bacterium]